MFIDRLFDQSEDYSRQLARLVCTPDLSEIVIPTRGVLFNAQLSNQAISGQWHSDNLFPAPPPSTTTHQFLQERNLVLHKPFIFVHNETKMHVNWVFLSLKTEDTTHHHLLISSKTVE